MHDADICFTHLVDTAGVELALLDVPPSELTIIRGVRAPCLLLSGRGWKNALKQIWVLPLLAGVLTDYPICGRGRSRTCGHRLSLISLYPFEFIYSPELGEVYFVK